MPSLRLSRKERNEAVEQQEIEKHYAIGLSRLKQTVHDELLKAHDCAVEMDNPIALQVYTELYGYSAKNMALAVKLHPSYFTVEDIPPDWIVSLRIMAQLSKEKEAKLFKEWEAQRWPAWKVFEEVQALKRRRPRHSKQRGVITRAQVKKSDGKLIVTPEIARQADGISGEFEVRFYTPTEEE